MKGFAEIPFSPCQRRALLAAEGAPVEESRLGFVSHWAGDRFHHTTILTLVERNLLRLDGRYPGRKAILTSDGGEAIRHWRITREAAA